MEITYLGLSCVRLRGREVQVLVDPPEIQLPGLGRTVPDLVVRTEGRTDTERLRGGGDRSQEIAGAGEYEVHGVTVQAIPVGEERTVSCIEVDDVRVVSVGRLNRTLSEEELEAIGHVDVLLAPVGGGDALGPTAATRLVNAVEPAIVVPVRYRSAAPGSGDYEPVEMFAKEMGLVEGSWQSQPKLTLSGGSGGSEDSRVVILEARGL